VITAKSLAAKNAALAMRCFWIEGKRPRRGEPRGRGNNMKRMIETNDSRAVNSVTAGERARKVYQSLPAEKKEIILDKLNEHRSTAWARSIAERKGKALSNEHKAKLGASKRGRAWKRAKVSLWAKAEDALLGLSTTESAKKRGVRQGAVYQSRRKMGFPPGWPGAYRHGEVLTRMHIDEFSDDVGLMHEEATEFIGCGYGAFRNLVGKIPNRPLSSRHPGDPKLPHVGRLLKEKCEQVVSRFCYEQGKRWRMRNFLQSEARGLPEKHATLTLAFTVLGETLRSGEIAPETELVMQWICERSMQEFASASETVFRTLLFLGLPLRELLDAQPELLRTEGDPQSGFRPSRLASELLAQDYGSTPGRIDAVIKGEVLPLDPRLLCVLVRQELERRHNEQKKKCGPDPKPDEQTQWFKVGRMVEEEISLFDSIFEQKAKLSRDIRKARLKCAEALQARGFSPEPSEAASRSDSAKGAAVCLVAGREGLEDDSVDQYHRRYLRWLKKHASDS
jgi:hypothetical protein